MAATVGVPEGFQLIPMQNQPSAGGQPLGVPEGAQLGAEPTTGVPQGFQLIPMQNQLPPGSMVDRIGKKLTDINLRNQDKQRSVISKSAQSAMAGVNLLFPALAGLPVDTVQNIINIGLSLYGGAKGAMGEDVSKLPELVGSLPWGSKDIENRISKGMGGSPFEAADNTPLQQYIRMAASIMGSGALAPAASIPEAAGNIARMAPSAMGAVFGKMAFPEQPLAPIIGTVLGGAVKPTYQEIRASAVKPTEAFLKAKKLGLRVPPSLAKPSIAQQAIEGGAGPVPTKQMASVYNQKVINNLIKKDLNYHKDIPLSPEGLDAIRAEAGKVYDRIGNIGEIKIDNTFKTDLAKISKKGTALAEEFPGLAKKDVEELTSQFGRSEYSSKALVEAIKQLRSDAKVGFKSQDPSITSMAKAQSKIATSIEGMMERSLSKTHPDLLPEFREARKMIAKTYTVEKALKGENVDAIALSRELGKRKPLSGVIKQIAEFGQNFKGAAQVSPPQQSNFRPMDWVTASVGTALTHNPAWLLALAARPVSRAVILSDAYQARLARVYPKQIADIKRLAPKSQVTAILSLLHQIKSQGAQVRDAQVHAQHR